MIAKHFISRNDVPENEFWSEGEEKKQNLATFLTSKLIRWLSRSWYTSFQYLGLSMVKQVSEVRSQNRRGDVVTIGNRVWWQQVKVWEMPEASAISRLSTWQKASRVA